MEPNNSYLWPVTYHELSHEFSRWKFNKLFTKISGSIYLKNDLIDDPHLVTQALLKRCPNGVLRGYAALKQRGYQLFDDPWMPIISVSGDLNKRQCSRGKIIRRIDPKTILTSGDIRLVTDVQAIHDIFDLHSLQNFEHQVALIDHLIRQRPDLFQELAQEPKLKKHALYANAYSESPPESRLRVRLHLLGYRAFLPQVRVEYEGQSYFLDLADPMWQVALEYNGGWHYTSKQREKDSYRKNALKNAGWDVLEVTAKTLENPDSWNHLLQQINNALRRKQAQRRRRLPMQTVI
ncbi:hypothetical protein N24_1528 [Corynebacterium suranareeae]|uniref:DUF559 domain-containing protein n=1 Tax=Corynebacterium suranareeae TaxID=2506452 RepID=A0A160PTG9_9CORY|nr:hypothetical protein [Corynebacterium suranareeae]BAU95790.1 hypothetical protein N24_1528 [Corynebacterium suranareeae]